MLIICWVNVDHYDFFASKIFLIKVILSVLNLLLPLIYNALEPFEVSRLIINWKAEVIELLQKE